VALSLDDPAEVPRVHAPLRVRDHRCDRDRYADSLVRREARMRGGDDHQVDGDSDRYVLLHGVRDRVVDCVAIEVA